MLTRKQKEELIIKLLEEGRTFKEISKIAHASYSQISQINKRLQGDDSQPNIRNQAYRMYNENKDADPISVAAIALQIDEAEATKYWHEYLLGKKEFKLLKIRKELKGDYSAFVNFYMEMKSKHCGLNELKKALEIVRKTRSELVYLSCVEDDKKKC